MQVLLPIHLVHIQVRHIVLVKVQTFETWLVMPVGELLTSLLQKSIALVNLFLLNLGGYFLLCKTCIIFEMLGVASQVAWRVEAQVEVSGLEVYSWPCFDDTQGSLAQAGREAAGVDAIVAANVPMALAVDLLGGLCGVRSIHA